MAKSVPLSPKPLLDAEPVNRTSFNVVVEWPSGIEYTAQVGGYACLHPEVEGILFTLGDFPDEFAVINEFFYGPSGPWSGWCCEGIDEKTADFVDGQLVKMHSEWRRGTEWRCDRSRLKYGREAWIAIETDCFGANDWTSPKRSGVKATGWLTWENSD